MHIFKVVSIWLVCSLVGAVGNSAAFEKSISFSDSTGEQYTLGQPPQLAEPPREERHHAARLAEGDGTDDDRAGRDGNR